MIEKVRCINSKINYKLIVNTIIVFNIIDLLLTYVGLKIGYFVEGNKLLEQLYLHEEFLFIGVKVLSIIFFAFVTKKFINAISEKIKILFFIPLFVYGYIMILHLIILYFELIIF